jgi:manganese oxidase
MRSPRPAILLLALYSVASTSFAADSSLPVVAANDNRTPAGQLANGVLNLNLELRQGRWYPEEEGGVYRDVYAFAEKGQAPQSSGPLIRVAQGTRIHATVRNTLPATAKIYGLHSHPGDPQDAVSVAPGETRELEFAAGEPGTYLYWATTADHSLKQREEQETLLSGAFVGRNRTTACLSSVFGQKVRKKFPSSTPSPGRTRNA